MGVLGPVVEVARLPVFHRPLQLPVRHTVGAELVGDQHPRHLALLAHQLGQETPGRLGVPPGLDEDVQDVAGFLGKLGPILLGLLSDSALDNTGMSFEDLLHSVRMEYQPLISPHADRLDKDSAQWLADCGFDTADDRTRRVGG